MALVMEFKDNYGNDLPSSYWRLVQVNVSIPDKAASLAFFGYVSKDARDKMRQPIGSKQYSILGEQFEVWYDSVLTAKNTNLTKSCYEYAKATKDVNKNNVIASFFDDATNA